ncbi:hypothetical protein F2Q70_00002848 [Brassica cretica]|uniref:Uncharacterized protein n=1 Tax=Brassica cretica TaxID=69181 RepID=A0A8S9IUT0_BRACR|nr:hypothetical protein F2Q70_00002848 [Brassica cretica]
MSIYSKCSRSIRAPSVKCSGLLFRNHQGSRLHHLQDTAKSPELRHLQQEISSSRRYCQASVYNKGIGTPPSLELFPELSRNKGQTVGEKYSGIKFLKTPGRTKASGSPLGDTTGPCWEALWVRSQGPPPSSRKSKYSGKGILPYFRIWKSLTLLADQDRPIDDYIKGAQTLEQGINTSRLRD